MTLKFSFGRVKFSYFWYLNLFFDFFFLQVLIYIRACFDQNVTFSSFLQKRNIGVVFRKKNKILSKKVFQTVFYFLSKTKWINYRKRWIGFNSCTWRRKRNGCTARTRLGKNLETWDSWRLIQNKLENIKTIHKLKK